MRKYTPVWNNLKQSLEANITKGARKLNAIGVCRLAAHRALHPRIIKAISKEKLLDVGYRFALAETGHKAIVTHKREGAEIKFFLRLYELNEPVTVEDLL